MVAAPASAFPGPDALGRGVVVSPGAPSPRGFEHAPRLRIDDAVLAVPDHVAAALHRRWLRRERVVVELAVDNASAREPETERRPPHELPDDLTFQRERLHFLTWANNYDLRSGEPRWWHGVLAQRRTAAAPSDHADLTLPGGGPAWVDGGPRGPLAEPPTGGSDLPIVHRESVGLGRLTILGDRPPQDDLSPDQLAAVTHRAGPARIIAPAGSGKTRVLTARLRHLLRDRMVEPELVTAVAYNTRAAAEMRQRTQDLAASIRTLHSLALWICNLDERREVVGERDVRSLLDGMVTTARIPNQDPFQPYLEALAEVRLALRDPAEVEALRGDVDGFTAVFERYREELARRRWLDFDEQIYRACELLLTRPDLRARAQRVGTHLLVDEFQDLTPAFLLLIRLVAGPSMQVFAVGDDDQTIYSYAGATPRFLVDFQRWFPGAAEHALEVNYRCPPDLVAAAVSLLGHNRTRVVKTIRPGRASHPPPAGETRAVTAPALDVHLTPSGAVTGRAVALITAAIADGVRTGGIAVLARVNSALLPVQVALTEAAVPHTAPLDASVLGRTGVRTALAYLRLGLDLDRIRREDLFDTINRPARKVKSAVQPLLTGSRFSIGQLEQVADSLGDTHRDRYEGYLADLRTLDRALADGATTGECFAIVRTRIGLGEAMDALDSSKTRPEGSSHGDDLDALEQLATLHPDPGSFREWLTERLRVPADPDGVTLSTVHRVKGMEWDRVVVFAANQGLFPHRLADDVEEERRVFHVAVTRCRERVDVVADRQRTSPFVAELTRASSRPQTDAPARQHAPARVAASRLPDGAVEATVGLVVEVAGGHRGIVVEVGSDGVVLHAGDPPETEDDPLVLRVPFGQPVQIDGAPSRLVRSMRIARPTTTAGGRLALDGVAADPPVDDALYEALRSWRARIAADSGVPAYLVFHDRHLQVIAGRKPGSVRELAACPGVGPTKLERYADDVLDLVDRHRA